MPRIARIVHPGCPHHVTHRGNRRESIFLDDYDRRGYLALRHESCQREGVRIWAYCLMPNHVHLIVVGDQVDSLARGIGIAHRRHSRRINLRRGWTGHVWANRFFSTPLNDMHLWMAARYVETNPVRAGLTDEPAEFPWSSARAHLLGHHDPLLACDRPFPGAIEDWRAWLLAGKDDPAMDVLRANTAACRS
jgi:putative transposase